MRQVSLIVWNEDLEHQPSLSSRIPGSGEVDSNQIKSALGYTVLVYFCTSMLLKGKACRDPSAELC